MKPLRALGAAAFGLLTTCSTPKQETPPKAQTPTPCERLRAESAAVAILVSMTQTPEGMLRLGSNVDEIMADSDRRLREALAKVEDPMKCLRETEL